MAKILTQVLTSPGGVARWGVVKDKEINNAFSQDLGAAKIDQNATDQTSTVILANGKIRVTYVHRFPTQANLDAYMTILNQYASERNAYNAANGVEYSQTVTEE